jgi:spermidine/putrescine transport system permease protein
MSAVGTVIGTAQAELGPEARSIRAYRLRYMRAAGFLFVASAVFWIGLLIWVLSTGELSESTPSVIVTLHNLASNTSPLLLVVGAIAFAVIDGLIAAALLQMHPLAQRAAQARAIIGLSLSVLYFATTRDFLGALAFGIVQALILVLLTRKAGLIMSFPGMIWLAIFFVVPLVSVLAFSLGRGTARGAVDMSSLTLENYVRIFQPVGVSGLIYVNIVIRTLWLAFLNTVICLLIGYPFAFWMARQPERIRNALMLLVMIPFWTSILVRTYAWLIILRKDGILNDFLIQGLHLIDQPLELTNTPGALLLGMVYDYLPFMILPLYTSIERLESSLVEAASDLYASPRHAFLRVILPLTMPGIVAGSILVFIPSVGTYLISTMLGGGRFFLIGNLLEQQFIGTTGNRAFGAAIGSLLAVFMLIATVLYFRLGRRFR